MVVNNMKDLFYLIEKVIELPEFWTASYYARCMKKSPHGGVMRIYIPNGYLKYYPFQAWTFVSNNPEEIPYFMIALVDIATTFFAECDQLDIEDLMQFCFSGDNWYLGFRLLHIKPECVELDDQLEGPLLWYVLERKERLSDYYYIEPRYAVYGLILTLLEGNALPIPDVQTIVEHESLLIPHNKYGLTEIREVEFRRQGFVFDKKYFLYNIFIDPTIGSPNARFPLTFEVITKEIEGYRLFMRCDNNLSVPVQHIYSTATVDFQKYHGITISFANIESVLHKEIIVHIHPDLLHKIVVIIKPDYESNEQFFHVEVEELWNPCNISDDTVNATFLHAKFFPTKKAFTHIDFSVNQYDISTYSEKYAESVNATHVPIDKYGTFHYKVWCVEAPQINIETWSKLVCATLDEPFREIFLETFTYATTEQ